MSTIRRHPERVTAQVAVEAVVNAPEGYDENDMVTVLHVAESVGVADLYLDLLRELLGVEGPTAHRHADDCDCSTCTTVR